MWHDQQLRNAKYKNWVKAGLGLKYLGNGLAPFVDEAVKKQHEDMLSDIKKSYGASTRCENCKLESLMPIHTSGQGNRCPLGHKPNCNCRSPRGKHVCPTKLCSTVYDKLVIQHRYSSPNWKNTDNTQWFDNHWQIAKTFIPAGGYEHHTSVRNTDCAGLLNIIINNNSMYNLLDTVIDAPNDIFSRTRKARDDIFHSSSMELEDAELDTILDDMMAILEDEARIKNMPDAVDAKKNITQLRNQNFVITMYDEAEIRKNAMDAIEEMKQLALETISDKQRQVLDEIHSCGLQQSTTTTLIEQRLEGTQQIVQAIQEKQHQLETSVANLKDSHLQLQQDVRALSEELAKMKSDELDSKIKANHTEALRYIEEKKALQRDLVHLYNKHYSWVPLYPLMQEKEVKVEETYAKPTLKILKGKGIIQSNSKVDVTSYKDIFSSGESRHQNIYINGDAGIGKSAFCKQLISAWCKVHGQSHQCGADVLDDSVFAEIAAELKSFEFLFFISLRHSKEDSHLHELIKNQLLQTRRYKDLFEKLLEEESDKCLIILDGLDEWKENRASVVPERNLMANYTIITTTRPWVLERHRLKDSELDVSLELCGVGPSSAKLLAARMIEHFNTTFNRNREVASFEKEMLIKDLTELRKIPILLQQMVCVWHEFESLGNSQCDIYSGMLSLLFQVAEQNRKITTVVQLPTSNRLPVCFRDQPECKKHEPLILSLAKLAFETMFCTQSEPLLVFPSSQMEICGMSAQEMEQCLSVGILTQSEAVGISAVTRYKTVAFIHPTFHEFLAALHIAVQCSTAKGEVPKKLSDEIFANVYERCRTFNEILSHSTVFKFLFGMDPMVGKKISEHVQKIVVEERDRSDTLALSSVHSKSMFSTACGRLINETNEGVHRLNAMFLDWIEEGEKSGHENIQIVCSEITDLGLYHYVDPLHVKTITFFWVDLAICSPIKHSGPLEGLHISDCSSVDLMKETIAELIVRSKETLTTLHLDFEDVTRGPSASKDLEAFLNPLCEVSTLQNVALTNLSVSHSSAQKVVLFISKLKRLTSLYLENVFCRCDDKQCCFLDMSTNNELQHMHSLNCCIGFQIPQQVNIICADEAALANIACNLDTYRNINVFSFHPTFGSDKVLFGYFCANVDIISSISLAVPTFKFLNHLQISCLDLRKHTLLLALNMKHLMTVDFNHILMKDVFLNKFLRSASVGLDLGFDVESDTSLFIRRLKMVFHDEIDQNRDFRGLQKLSNSTRNLVHQLREKETLVILSVVDHYWYTEETQRENVLRVLYDMDHEMETNANRSSLFEAINFDDVLAEFSSLYDLSL